MPCARVKEALLFVHFYIVADAGFHEYKMDVGVSWSHVITTIVIIAIIQAKQAFYRPVDVEFYNNVTSDCECHFDFVLLHLIKFN